MMITTETIVCDHRSACFKKCLLFYKSMTEDEFPEVLWPVTIYNSLVSYALEQPEMLRSHDYKQAQQCHVMNGKYILQRSVSEAFKKKQ